MESAASSGRADLLEWQAAHPTNYFSTNPDHQRSLGFRLGPQRYQQILSGHTQSGEDAAGPIADNGRLANREENLPRLERFSGVGVRTEEVVFHPSYHEMGALIWKSGVLADYAKPGQETAQLSLLYLFSQNGELGHLCPLACTAGLIKLLQAVGSKAQKEQWLPGLLSPNYDERIHASQFLTEVQGGSDVGANAVVAKPDGDGFRIHGEKWFCSVIDAQTFLMTARLDDAAKGTKGLSLFLVPRVHNGATNEFYIRRLKWKLGTRAMASAEVDFRGAYAEAVGPLSMGFKNVVENVLDTSRLYNAICCAGAMRRSYIEARNFAAHRKAFGQPINRFPLIREAISTLRAESMAAFSSSMRLAAQGDQLSLGQGDADLRASRRVGVNVNKYWTSIQNTKMARLAMEVFGGNGAIESFSLIPQLYRDAMVLESWEGTHNTLVEQVMRDAQRLQLHLPFFAQLNESISALKLGDDDQRLIEAVRQGIGACESAMKCLSQGDGDQRWGRRVVDQMAVSQALVSMFEELNQSPDDEACRSAIRFLADRDLKPQIDRPLSLSDSLI
jgi:acyl-CoA dehydrogenase